MIKQIYTIFSLLFLQIAQSTTHEDKKNIFDFIEKNKIKINIVIEKDYLATADVEYKKNFIDYFKIWCNGLGGNIGWGGNNFYPVWYCQSEKIVAGGTAVGLTMGKRVYFWSGEKINPSSYITMTKIDYSKSSNYFSEYRIEKITDDANGIDGFPLYIKTSDGVNWIINESNTVDESNSERIIIDPVSKRISLAANGRERINNKGNYSCIKMLHTRLEGERNKIKYDICLSKFISEADEKGSFFSRTFSSIGLLGLGHVVSMTIDSQKILEALHSIPSEDLDNVFKNYKQAIEVKRSNDLIKLNQKIAREKIDNELSEEFRSRRIEPGVKVCRTLETGAGLITVFAFIEQDTLVRLNLRIISTGNLDSIFFPDGSSWSRGTITWDLKSNWSYCKQ
jgi:hypothetical protein